MKTKLFFLSLFLLAAINLMAYDFKYGDLYYHIISSSTVEVARGDYAILSTINIPSSVTYNGKNYRVTSIGESAFYGCINLTSITIPNSVTNIGYGAFYNTPWYDNQPAGVIYINSVLYKYKGNKHEETSIVVKEGITSIAPGAFEGCNLKSITIPNSVTSIGEFAFYLCSGLTSITIPNNVTSIGDYAFYACNGLTSITIPNSVTNIGKHAFDETPWYDNQPDGVIYINSVLYKYKGNMLKGTSIVVKKEIASISPYAFYGCSGLKSITIPKSVTKIGKRIIERCSDLHTVVVERGNPIYDSRSNCNAIIETATNTLIAGCGGTVIPNTVETIGEYAFYRCDSLRSIIIPSGVKSIESSAFDWCENLTTISIPNSVIKIGDYVFGGCKSDSITIPGSVIDWGKYTFSSEFASSLSSVIIGNGVTYIPEGTFSHCINLKTVVIPNSITRIERDAFGNCSSLETIAIPNSVTTIETGAFDGCSNLTTITIPNSVTTIETKAFYGCSNLTTITIPNSVIFVGAGAFAYCSGLTSVTCYAIEPPSITNTIHYFDTTIDFDTTIVCDPFEGLPTMPLYVPAESVEKYKQAECWKDFIVLPLSAKPADVDEPILNPSDNDVEIVWPQDPSATTYTIEIRKDDDLVCSLVFDANGVLQTIRFGAPSRSQEPTTAKAPAANNGFSFVVEGLESGTTYHYTINATNSAGNILQTYSGTFKTTGIEMGIDDAGMNRTPTKFIRDGKVVIRKGDKHYTATGIELE